MLLQFIMTGLPAGLIYLPGFLSPRDEVATLETVRSIPYAEIRMHGVVARRRTAHFGLIYGYESWKLTPGPALPAGLEPLRRSAAALAGVEPADFAEILVTEYPPGAGIGWHRDAPMFGVVVGISLLGSCRLRMRRDREKAEVMLEPRSAYVLAGEARHEWRHSIPPVLEARYSITFRTLRPSLRAASGGRPIQRGRGRGNDASSL